MRVRWTRLALEDLESARQFLAERNPTAASRVVVKIGSALRALRQYPAMGRTGRVEGTRELVIPGSPFVLVYRLARQAVEILAIIHGARRWPEGF